MATAGPLDPDAAAATLAELVALRRAGLREPLPLPTVAGHTYATVRRGGADPVGALDEALRKWTTGAGAERADAAHVRAWGPDAGPEVLSRARTAGRGAHPVRHARAAGLVPAAHGRGRGTAMTVIPFPTRSASVLAPAAFDVCGALPTGTTVLEASAGTGKTFTIAALATRYVAEGHAALPELMLVTFGREATQELRERVRERLVSAERGLADPAAARAGADDVLRLLAEAPDAEVAAPARPARPRAHPVRRGHHRHHPPVLPADARGAGGGGRRRPRRGVRGVDRRHRHGGRRRLLRPQVRRARRRHARVQPRRGARARAPGGERRAGAARAARRRARQRRPGAPPLRHGSACGGGAAQTGAAHLHLRRHAHPACRRPR